MKSVIAKTPQYELEVSVIKNRAYLKIIGFWRSPEAASSYLDDWRKALLFLKPGFTLLTDAREMKIHPGSVRVIHEQAQALVVQKGVRKVAELQMDKVTEIQLNGLSSETHMPKMNFSDPQEAEQWLDSL